MGEPMSKKIAILSVGALLLVLLLTVVAGYLPSDASAAGSILLGPKKCPYALPLDKVQLEIAEIMFTDLVPGIGGRRMRLGDKGKDKFRFAVATIRVKKPAGMRLTIAAADLTIHYYHGTETEATCCEGISTFSRTLDVDRPMQLASKDGPGFVKQTTGARATQATEVFIDAAFGLFEPDTRECWLCLGQPRTTAPYLSKGWQK
jgi:hypothetical protein